MKNLAKFALAVVVSLSLTSIYAFADTSGTDGGIDWEIDGTTLILSPSSNPDVKYTTDDGGEVEYNSGEMKDYPAPNTSEWCSNILMSSSATSTFNVTIKDGVKNLGTQFLKGLTIDDVTIEGNSLETIDEQAFIASTGLSCINSTDTERNIINIPEGVKTIGNAAFVQNSAIQEVNFPESLIEIGASSFAGNENLDTINFPHGEFTVSSSAFQGAKIKELTVSGNMTLSGRAFSTLSELETLTILGNNDIPESAFEYCTSLKTISIMGEHNIDSTAFNGCTSIETVYTKYDTSTANAGCFNSDNVNNSITDSAYTGCAFVYLPKVEITSNNNSSYTIEIDDNFVNRDDTYRYLDDVDILINGENYAPTPLQMYKEDDKIVIPVSVNTSKSYTIQAGAVMKRLPSDTSAEDTSVTSFSDILFSENA